MQGEVIKSLQMAAQFEHAVLNLTLLYEASITNRKATFVTLDELKQRLLPRLPIERQIQLSSESSSHGPSRASMQTIGSTSFDPTSYVPDNYIPAAVTLTSQNDMRDTKHGLTSYFKGLKRNSSSAGRPSSARESTASADINFSQAFQHLMDARGTQDKAVIMQEIDEIMDAYQGLHISQPSNEAWAKTQYGNGYGDRRDTLTMLSRGDPERSISQSIVAATNLGTAPAAAGLRHHSIAPSIASTDSSTSGTLGVLPGARIGKAIRTDTISSGPAGAERMMNGRPCKANNYWGFCKGAWTIREDVKKGLTLRTQPLGMYNTKELWECTSCTFKGSTFPAPHPTKKNKEITVVDPRIATSASGIRYKWIFLAKSHVNKKAGDSHTDESNYGCVLCSLEDKVSSVYGGVETLMNHIALCHVADMSENTRRKARCIIGRVAGKDETEWDINIPVFAQVGELA
ncbi:hypothetical protein EK21DRAFT_72049 [Setomelanomma holmii]|uniref:Uncharacterized protein n=1 Tax=Setomelanomma holmii TaxID=210430 RepID=A0A9P4H661_9PLEO|nr:hypothetical protein EK21DRAFT_72049 [Setomelanomma holmii]